MPYLVQSQIGIEIEQANDKNADGRSRFGLVGSGLTSSREGATPTLLCRAISLPP